ncbi:MAG: polysaccharide pyruvyl transferase family protein [bacterium]|nr:polysaccharide pyruvyl transferase family protein [bacterium]
MKKIMLYQHGGSYNHGCEALATTISAEVLKNIKNAQVYLCSHHADQDKQYNIKSIHKIIQNTRWLRRGTLGYFVYQIDRRTFNSKRIQDKFEIDKPCIEMSKDMDCCIAIGGDNYCYNKGKIYWPTERVIKKSGKKMMLWGCSVEPEELSGELAEHLQLFDAITVRDSITYEAFIKNGFKGKVHLVADPAFLLEKEELPLPENWKEGQMVGINLSPMILNYTKNKEQVVKSIYALIDYILNETDMNVVLVPHVRLSYTDDMDTLRPIFEQYKHTNRVLLLDDYSLSCKQLKGYIARCRFFIGARTHSIVAAYSTGVPALALGYSVKSKGIARDIFGNEENLVLPVQTFNDPKATIEGFKYLIEHEEEIKNRLNSFMPEYKKKAEISGKVLKELVGE